MVEDERLEQLIALIGSQLPRPVDEQTSGDGSMVFTGGAPPEVVVHLRDTSVRVSEYGGVWEAPGRFTVKLRPVGMVKWRRLSETVLMQVLSLLIRGAREARLGSYRTCLTCHKRYPPEMFAAGDVCPWCAEVGPVVH